MKQHLVSKWSFVILTFAFVLVGFAQQVSLQFPSASPMDFTTGRVRIRVVPIATGLAHPRSLAFLPDGRLLVAEQAGRIRVIRVLAAPLRMERY
jgi:glucose/arabinose dehydrogenase